MAARYTLTLLARQDLAGIRSHLTQAASVHVARHVIARIREALDLLAANPGAGHSRTDLTDLPLKFWPVFSYLVVDDPAMQPIGIARVLHGRRDLAAVFQYRPPRA